MKVVLDIHSDKELRDYVKELINGQVKSLNRETYIKTLQETYAEKIPKDFDNILRQYIKELVRDVLRCNAFNSTSVIVDIAREEIQKLINNALIDKNIIIGK